MSDTGAETLAPGVVHRALPMPDGTGIDIIDIDLANAAAHATIVAQGIHRESGFVTGSACTPAQWLAQTGAIAAINGGYFGQEISISRKEIVGLLVQKGKVRHASPPLYGRGSATVKRGSYLRSAFGLTAQGNPCIVWAATDPANPQRLKAYGAPMSRRGVPWPIESAIGCGPMLIFQGKTVVTDYAERLVSPGPQARTFLAYDFPRGHPKHLILGMASGITFQDLAAFVSAYFPQYDHSQAAAAMCLDGGASAQITYRNGSKILSPRAMDVAVPDAVVVLPIR